MAFPITSQLIMPSILIVQYSRITVNKLEQRSPLHLCTILNPMGQWKGPMPWYLKQSRKFLKVRKR
jgi:hypothetical protein